MRVLSSWPIVPSFARRKEFARWLERVMLFRICWLQLALGLLRCCVQRIEDHHMTGLAVAPSAPTFFFFPWNFFDSVSPIRQQYFPSTSPQNQKSKKKKEKERLTLPRPPLLRRPLPFRLQTVQALQPVLLLIIPRLEPRVQIRQPPERNHAPGIICRNGGAAESLS